MNAAPVLTEAPPGPPGGGPPTGDAKSVSRTWVLLVNCVSAATVVASVTSLNVTASKLIQEVGLSFTQLQWVIAAYAVTLAGMLLPAGEIGLFRAEGPG